MPTENDLPKKYLSPKLMVIGDSLAQGCRSLTVKKEFNDQSYGAVLAGTQGWSFTAAQHPLPVLADVEDLIRRSGSLTVYATLVKKVRENIDGWKSIFAQAPTGTPLCFDNVAIASSDIKEIAGYGSASYAKEFDTLLKDYNKKSGLKQLGAAAPLHLPINGRYTLNPSGDGAFNKLSQLDWVRLRKPQHLIAHFGHNNGLYPIGGLGQVPGGNGLLAMKRAYLEVVKEILDLPKEVGHIVLILLPKVSCVANLMPSDEDAPAPASGYHPHYVTKFPYSNIISGKDLKDLDSQIKEINGAARMLASAAMSRRRITVVEAYDVFSRYDFKNTGNPRAQVTIGRTVIDNRYLHGRYIPGPVLTRGPGVGSPKYTFGHGGFQSLDGMHLSAVGYAVLADYIAREMGLKRDEQNVLRTALKNEKLITSYPSALNGFLQLVNSIRGLIDKPGGNEEVEKSDQGPHLLAGSIARCFCNR